jgi:hypothetical protein
MDGRTPNRRRARLCVNYPHMRQMHDLAEPVDGFREPVSSADRLMSISMVAKVRGTSTNAIGTRDDIANA